MRPAAPPLPVRSEVAAFANEDELAVSVPLTTPSDVGVKTMPVVQLAPGARIAVQVFWVMLNGGVTVNVRSVAELLAVLVMTAF